MAITPTQRTLAHLREQGFYCEIVEKWNSFTRTRKDYLDIIDILALDPNRGVIGVQSTGQAFSEHLKKILIEKQDKTRLWLTTPGTSLYLYGWRKLKQARGKKTLIWVPRIQEITLSDLDHDYSNLSDGDPSSTDGFPG